LNNARTNLQRCQIAGQILVLCVAVIVPGLRAQVNILTQHNDNGRTGNNPTETILNTVNVNTATFGKLFTRSVDGNIYAQPLYVSAVQIAGSVRNVVFVATAHNTVYAFDGDDPNSSNPLWAVSLGPAVPSQDICTIAPPQQCPYTDIVPEIGVIATPVIDLPSGTLYATANTKDLSGSYHWTLHALDLTTGSEKSGGPVEISAPGFDPFEHLNRPGLLMANGNIYLAFGSVGDYGSWHGWVMAYNAATLQQTGWFSATPNGNGSGIWQCGDGLIADSEGNIYFATGNGSFDLNTGGLDFGSSYIKLSGIDLTVLDYFAPNNQSLLNGNNKDLGSGGALMIPGTSLLVGGGKEGIVRVVNGSAMGGFDPNQNNDVQEFTATHSPLLGSPVYWNSPDGPTIYLWGRGDVLKAWRFDPGSGLFDPNPAAQGIVQSADEWSNTATLSLSSDQDLPLTGIIWASMPSSGIANPGPVPGILYAVDAQNPANELWNSKLNPNDDFGNYAKFNPATVANGKVYLGTFSNQLVVYGLTVTPDFSLDPTPSGVSVVAGQNATYSISVKPVAGFHGTVSFTCTGLPAGTTCSFSPTVVDLNVSNTTNTVMTVTTTAHVSTLYQRNKSLGISAMLLPMLGLVLVGTGSYRKMSATIMVLLSVFLLLSLFACGGGNATVSNNTAPHTDGGPATGGSGNGDSTGTPSGTSSLVITATAGSNIHNASVVLTVQ